MGARDNNKREVSLQLETEKQIAEHVARYYDDPLGFVLAIFPWGEAQTFDGRPNSLANKKGPEPWQINFLTDLGEHIKENADRKAIGLDYYVWRSGVASGHGIGKGAMTAWLILFFMSTRADTRGVTTANTGNQLATKTWPELSKWHTLALNKHWFTWTATSFYFALYDENKRKNYAIDAMPYSEDNTEAFAGLHNEGRTVISIFDEASGIRGKVWDVVQGAMTDGEGFFFTFGNPTQPDGDFAEIFESERYKGKYHLYTVDSRDVSHTNKQALQDIIDMYGADSDEARVRVYGQFPSRSFNGFIPHGVVADASDRELFIDSGAALIMAIDVARFGGDETVFGWRKGRDARSRPFKAYKGLSTVQTVELAMQEVAKEKPDAVVVESTGPGAGVIDQLRARGVRVIEVHPGSAAVDFKTFGNKRAEMWAKMRDWLVQEGCISDDLTLKQQLVCVRYLLDRQTLKMRMEPKDDIAKRGLPSPDRADTLALTFGATVVRRDVSVARNRNGGDQTISDYDPFEQ
jgi:hypothetical protein